MSLFRRLRRQGQRNIPQGQSNTPKRTIARLVRVHDGYELINEHFIPKAEGIALNYTLKKAPTKLRRTLRNLRKRQRKAWPLSGLRASSVNTTLGTRSVRDAIQLAGESGFSHVRWNARLHACPPPKKKEDAE